MVGAALSRRLRPLKAKPETQIKMLSKKAMVGTALSSKFCPNKAILHKYKKGTRRTERATIPWDCRIANLQHPKQDSIVKNINKNTQESKHTFQSTKQTRPRRGQRPSAQSDKDKKTYTDLHRCNNNERQHLDITGNSLCPGLCPPTPMGGMRAKQTVQRRYIERRERGSSFLPNQYNRYPCPMHAGGGRNKNGRRKPNLPWVDKED
jgi:hypothetical protein